MALEFPIITTLDTKGINAADKAFKKLAGTFAAAFSVKAVTQFSKASVRAFIEDEKAARRLATTYKNLGLALEGTRVNDFVKQLEQSTGVASSSLRPALETLTRATLDFGEAQDLLTTSLDVSMGSGIELQTVANALSKAYLGNLSPLAKLNIGIGSAEAKSMDFAEALSRVNAQFKGQARAFADSYAGKLERLKIAADEAQKTIGKGLVTALEMLSADHSIDGLTSQMDALGRSVAQVTLGIADLLKPITTKNAGGSSIAKDLAQSYFGPVMDLYKYLEKRGQLVETMMTSAPSRGGAPGAQRLAAQQAKELEKQRKAQAAIIAAQKKAQADALKKEREAQQLKRAGSIFDMENIQIVAALQGKVTEEQRLRLTALLAINNDNADAADKLSKAILALQAPAFAALGVTISTSDNASTVIEKLIKAQTQLALVAGGITSLPKAKNPFEDWDAIIARILNGLSSINQGLNNISSASNNAISGGGGGGSNAITAPVNPPAAYGDIIPPVIIKPPGVNLPGEIGGEPGSVFQPPAPFVPQPGLPVTPIPIFPPADGGDPVIKGFGMSGGIVVNVNVNGSVTTESDLVTAITNAILNRQKSGFASSYSTNI